MDLSGHKFPMIVAGEQRWCSSVGEQAAIDPSTGKQFGSVVMAGEPELSEAIAAAREAVDDGRWRILRPDQRSRLLYRVAEMVESRDEKIAELDASDCGKPIRDCLYQVRESAEIFRYFAGLCDKIGGENVPPHGEYLSFTEREPYGVVGALIPWNSPFLLASEKVAPALAAGNAIVMKPAPEASLAPTLLGQICLEAGLPAGVVNVLCGSASLGELLVRAPGIDLLAVTGGVETGQKIAKSASDRLVPLLFELGGKSANIVFEDADLDAAADRALNAIFRGAGQSCVAGSRLFLQRSIAELVMERIGRLVPTIRIGPATDTQTQMGPVISEAHLRKIMSHVDVARKEGAELFYGGRRLETEGYFMQPTIFVGVGDNMRIATEEIFGPVLAVFTFDDEDEVIHRANQTKYGLAAAVWTNDFRRAYRVAKRLTAGMVWINTYRTTSPGMPFGGYKMSGYGRERGVEGYLAYARTKSIFVNTSSQRSSWLGGTWEPRGSTNADSFAG